MDRDVTFGSNKLLDKLGYLAGLRPALPLIPGIESSYTDIYSKHVCLAIYLKLETFHCCENMMTSDSSNPSWTFTYSLSCPVGGQEVSSYSLLFVSPAQY